MLQPQKHSSLYKAPILWGLLHGINDWLAGFMLAGFAFQQSSQNAMLMLIVYAIIGFGGQLPAGMWLDASANIRAFSKTSFVLLTLAPLVWFISPFAGIIVIGLSSAFVHVTGGAISLNVSGDKVGPLGLFTAPGVLGLALGSLLAGIATYWLAVPVIGILMIGWLMPVMQPATPLVKQTAKSLPDSHDWIMLGILLLVVLRSLLYDIIQQVSQNWQQGLLVIGISAFLGKIIGGFLADKIGWKKWVYITLPLSFVLLQFGRENIYMLGFGIFSLQSSVPISLLLMRRSLPAYPGVSAAMVLGVGVAISGLPLYLIEHQYLLTGWFGVAGITTAVIITAATILMLTGKWRPLHPTS